MAGPSWKSVVGTTVMLLVPSGVFWGLVVPKFLSSPGLAAALWAVSLTLVSLSMAFLFTTACIDPGVLPRNPGPDPEWLAGRRPRTAEVMVNGHKVVLRYNETCGFYQPPRAHHCSVNDNCIERFDHHCPWVGTTIGVRNYRFFLLFVFTTTLLCLFVLAICLYQLFFLEAQLSEESDGSGSVWLEVIKQSIAALIIMVYCFVLFWFVGGLSLFHTYLVSTNQTTYENFRYSHDGRVNPYNRGCRANCAEVFCRRLPKSKVNRRAYADEVVFEPPRIEGLTFASPGVNADGHVRGASNGHRALQNGAVAASTVGPPGVEVEMLRQGGSRPLRGGSSS